MHLLKGTMQRPAPPPTLSPLADEGAALQRHLEVFPRVTARPHEELGERAGLPAAVHLRVSERLAACIDRGVTVVSG
jgi:hypothetical protein